jgi:hypothetical protein
MTEVTAVTNAMISSDVMHCSDTGHKSADQPWAGTAAAVCMALSTALPYITYKQLLCEED